jgi:hypothetical protein
MRNVFQSRIWQVLFWVKKLNKVGMKDGDWSRADFDQFTSSTFAIRKSLGIHSTYPPPIPILVSFGTDGNIFIRSQVDFVYPLNTENSSTTPASTAYMLV